jgi:hypothetical protein
MSADDQIRLERRAAQRFDFQIPVNIRMTGTELEGYGFTQDLSGRGVFFYTDFLLAEGDVVELTLVMPSEVTLSETSRVRCRAKVLRVIPVEQKFGVAAKLEGYEYLPKAEASAKVILTFPQVSPAHGIRSNSPAQLSGKGVTVPEIAIDRNGTGRLGNG